MCILNILRMTEEENVVWSFSSFRTGLICMGLSVCVSVGVCVLHFDLHLDDIKSLCFANFGIPGSQAKMCVGVTAD